MRTLRHIKRQRSPSTKGPSIYQYEVLSRLYRNAKRKNIGYRKQSKKQVPHTLVIKTLQEKIKETSTIIERESVNTRTEGTEVSKDIEALVHRLSLLEKAIYTMD